MSRPKLTNPKRHVTATISSSVMKGIENYQKDDKNLTEDNVRPTVSSIIEDSLKDRIGPWIPEDEPEKVVHAIIKP